MKKSFKKSIAVLLAVLMVVCTFPMTSFAAEKPNINLQFGVFTLSNSSANRRTYTAGRKGSDYASANSGLMNAKLDYNKSTGTLVDPVDSYTYTVGDYFTATVLLENVSQLAATQVAVNYSSNLAPAGIDNERTAFAGEKTSTTSEVFTPGEPVAVQSGSYIYNTSDKTVGELSYIDKTTNTMYAIFATQDGGDYASTASTSIGVNTFTNTAVLATFAFKITAEGPISFSLANTTDADEAYYLGTLENGGNVSEYITYAPTENAGSTGLDFMGGNEYVATTKYTVTFKNADGSIISSTEYDEGAAVTVPDLPATSKDDTNHYTYSWDVEPSLTAVADATYQVVKTAAAHTWGEGVVTKEPTATEAGEKTYTCTFDGCGATKTEAIPATGETHTHTWGEWVYNGDAKYDDATKESTDGTQTRTCSTCGETETVTAPNTGKLYRIASQLTIDASILVKILVEKSVTDYYDEIYMSVTYPTKNGDMTEIINDYDIYYNNTYVRFAFDKINPHYLNEEAHYTIYGVKDGVTYCGDTYDFAITTYIKNQFTKYSVENYPNSYNNLRRLLADIIWYGYKAQIQQGYGIENGKKIPMTDYLTPEELACRTQGDLTLVDNGNASLVTIDNPSAQTGAALRMGASVDLAITLAKKTTACPDLWSLQVEVTKQGQAPEVFSYATHPEMFLANGNYVNFYYNGVKGNEASVPVDVRLLDANGNVISNTRRTSIESYCYKQINSSSASPALKDVCDAIMRYAKSSATYIANKQG